MYEVYTREQGGVEIPNPRSEPTETLTGWMQYPGGIRYPALWSPEEQAWLTVDQLLETRTEQDIEVFTLRRMDNPKWGQPYNTDSFARNPPPRP